MSLTYLADMRNVPVFMKSSRTKHFVKFFNFLQEHRNGRKMWEADEFLVTSPGLIREVTGLHMPEPLIITICESDEHIQLDLLSPLTLNKLLLSAGASAFNFPFIPGHWPTSLSHTVR